MEISLWTCFFPRAAVCDCIYACGLILSNYVHICMSMVLMWDKQEGFENGMQCLRREEFSHLHFIKVTCGLIEFFLFESSYALYVGIDIVQNFFFEVYSY